MTWLRVPLFGWVDLGNTMREWTAEAPSPWPHWAAPVFLALVAMGTMLAFGVPDAGSSWTWQTTFFTLGAGLWLRRAPVGTRPADWAPVVLGALVLSTLWSTVVFATHGLGVDEVLAIPERLMWLLLGTAIFRHSGFFDGLATLLGCAFTIFVAHIALGFVGGLSLGGFGMILGALGLSIPEVLQGIVNAGLPVGFDLALVGLAWLVVGVAHEDALTGESPKMSQTFSRLLRGRA